MLLLITTIIAGTPTAVDLAGTSLVTTAFAPILAALKTPKFGEFNAACEAVGIDMKLPAKIDWTAQQAVAQNVIAAAERNGKFVAPNGKEFAYELGLGSVMFIKGESAYNTWRAETIAKD